MNRPKWFVLLFIGVLAAAGVFIWWLSTLNLQAVYLIATIAILAVAVLALLLWKGMTHA